MKIPKEIKRYCPKCKKHNTVTVSQSKRKGLNATHHLTFGSRPRATARGRFGMGNHGRRSRPPIASFKMTGKKLTKKVDLLFKCKGCGKSFNKSGGGKRAKKVELI